LAGLGRKVFNSGDILLASEVQGYLQDQSVMVFEDAAARGSAIPSPTEGMVTFRKDDNALEVYDGAAFNPVGTEPGLVHIETQSPSGVASFSFSNDIFTSAYDNYFLIGYFTSTASNYILGRVRAAGSDISTTTYTQQKTDFGATSVATSRATGATSFELGFASTGNSELHCYIFKPKLALPTAFQSQNIRNSGTPVVQTTLGYNTNSTAYDSLSLIMGSGNMTGVFSVFGVKK
jgi:hypothetical protein